MWNVWSDLHLEGEARLRFQEAVAPYTLLLSSENPSALTSAEIAFGQPDPEIVRVSPRLRWVHLTSAGYTRYDRDDLRAALTERDAILTNSSRVYDDPCAQHTLAMMLAFARQMPACLEQQRDAHSWRTGELRAHSFLLTGQTTLFLGFGAIGRRLAELLTPFGMRLIAVRRTPRGDEGVEIVGEEDLETVLPLADHVVNLLPESEATRGFMDTARFARMKPGAFFYNIGRGATVDQDALRHVLETGALTAAYLDVTSPEPLPPDHPLWTAPHCYITPHTAGGHANERERLVAHFVQNLQAFERGEALTDFVMGSNPAR